MSTLGSRIKKARGKLSQDAFSKRIGVSKGSLGFYERDENLPNTDVVLKICSETGADLTWLLTGAEAQAESPPAEQPSSLSCPRCDQLEQDFRKEREEVRELTKELREINAENRTFLKENAQLREQVSKLEGELEKQKALADRANTDSKADAASKRKTA